MSCSDRVAGQVPSREGVRLLLEPAMAAETPGSEAPGDIRNIGNVLSGASSRTEAMTL